MELAGKRIFIPFLLLALSCGVLPEEFAPADPSEKDSDSSSETDNDEDTGADADTDNDGDIDTDTETDSEEDSDTGSDLDTDADTDTDSDLDTDSDTGGDTDADSDTETESNSETDTGTPIDTDTGTQTDSDADTDSETDTECPGNGADEDEDGYDDNCDNCPTYANEDQGDDDGDGLGNACEMPNHEEFLSEILVFDPLAETQTTQADWTPDDAEDWQFDEEGYTGENTGTFNNNPGSNTVYEGQNGELSLPFSVEAVFRYTDSAPSTRAWSSILFAVDGDEWWQCTFQWRENEEDRTFEVRKGKDETIASTEANDAENRRGVLRRIRIYYGYNGAENALCTFENSVEGVVSEIEFSPLDTGPDDNDDNAGRPVDIQGFAGLRVYAENTRFLSFAIYK